MNRKKRILSIILVLVILGGLFQGCGKKQSDNDINGNKENISQNEQNSDANNNEENANADNNKEDADTNDKLVSSTSTKAKVKLVTNGSTKYVIVRGKSASITEIYAAEELQKYLKLITGAKLPIVTDDTKASKTEIIVGKTNRETKNQFDRKELGEEGLIIKTTDSKLWLVGGGDRGTLYSVYTFLEDYLGCGFYTKYVEKVPEMKTIALKEIKEDKQIPVFKYRDVAWTDYTDMAHVDISAKRKINGNVWDRKLTDEVGGGENWALDTGGHTFNRLVAPEVYYKEHPEYYAMDKDGKRISHGQLCLSNPDIPGLIIKSAREWLKSDPDSTIIAISQNDLINPCLCGECMKIYEEEGGAYSGAIIRVVNEVAADLKKDYPDLKIVTFAYQYSRSVPAKTKPAENVYPLLCTIECCFSHPHSEQCDMAYTASYIDNTANTFAKDLEDWSKICNGNLWVYDYNCNFNFNNIMFPDLDNILPNYRWYAEHGVTGIMPEGQWTSTTGEFGALRSYLISKAAWNPYMSEEEYYGYMDDFLSAVYGEGGKYIRDYIELAEKLTENQCFSISADTGVYYMYPLETAQKHSTTELPKDFTVQMVKNYKSQDWTKYWNWYSDVVENDITVQGEKLFKQAMKLAKTQNEKANLERSYLHVENMKSYFYAKQLTGGEGTMFKLITQFIKMHQSEFTTTERETLPALIDAFAYEQKSSAYAEYNRDLCTRLVEWGITLNDNVRLWDFYRHDYTSIPCLWGIDENIDIKDIEIKSVSGNLAKVSVKTTDARANSMVQTQVKTFEVGASYHIGTLGYQFDKAVPKGLEGKSYFAGPLMQMYTAHKTTVKVEKEGWVYFLVQGIYGPHEDLRRNGFTIQAVYPPETLTSGQAQPWILMGKQVKAGETFSYHTYNLTVLVAEQAGKK